MASELDPPLGAGRREPLVDGEAGTHTAIIPRRRRTEDVDLGVPPAASQSARSTPNSGTKNEPSSSRNVWYESRSIVSAPSVATAATPTTSARCGSHGSRFWIETAAE